MANAHIHTAHIILTPRKTKVHFCARQEGHTNDDLIRRTQHAFRWCILFCITLLISESFVVIQRSTNFDFIVFVFRGDSLTLTTYVAARRDKTHATPTTSTRREKLAVPNQSPCKSPRANARERNAGFARKSKQY